MTSVLIASLDNIGIIAKKLKETLPKNCIIFLNGTLASGKTTLTQAILKEFDSDLIATSPTFSLQNIYDKNIYHYDLYRTNFDDIINLGLYEEFDKSGWHIIEWGDQKIKTFLDNAGYNTFNINIDIIDKNSRQYTLGA